MQQSFKGTIKDIAKELLGAYWLLLLPIPVWVGMALYHHHQTVVSNKSFQSSISTDQEVIAPLNPSDISTTALFDQVNASRAVYGIAPLVLDPLLDQSATDKCNDMVQKNYWSHNTPSGQTPWSFITKYENYSKVGENLATGEDTATGIVTEWLGSPEHRANIMDPDFTNVGYAVCYSPAYIGDLGVPSLVVVQHLLKP